MDDNKPRYDLRNTRARQERNAPARPSPAPAPATNRTKSRKRKGKGRKKTVKIPVKPTASLSKRKRNQDEDSAQSRRIRQAAKSKVAKDKEVEEVPEVLPARSAGSAAVPRRILNKGKARAISPDYDPAMIHSTSQASTSSSPRNVKTNPSNTNDDEVDIPTIISQPKHSRGLRTKRSVRMRINRNVRRPARSGKRGPSAAM